MFAQLLALVLVPGTAALAQDPSRPATQASPASRVRLEAQRIPDSLAAPEVAIRRLSREDAQQRIRSLIQALELPVEKALTAGRLQETKRGIARLRAGDHRFDVYLESGGIQYQSAELYRLTEAAGGESTPSLDALVARARRDLERLAAAKLIERDQIDERDVHVSHQRSRSAERSKDGLQLGRLVTLDSRLDFTRRLGELRVAGNGVRLIYGNDQKLYGCEIVWRPVRLPERKVPVAVSGGEALAVFREAVEEHRRQDSVVDLLQAELVYVDPGPTQGAAQLDPTYLFLYRVRTPIPEMKDEYIVGKKLQFSIPALKPTARDTQ